MTPSIEWQVSNLELSKRLRVLGVKQESYFYWKDIGFDYNEFKLVDHYDEWQDSQSSRAMINFSAFTVAELGDKILESGLPLPTWSYVYKEFVWLLPRNVQTENGVVGVEDLVRTQCKDEANARAQMLIYLIENKLIDPKSHTACE